jgi:hypothetical protein
MDEAQNVAPLLSAIEPATANPPDKPDYPAPNEAPAASPSRIAGSEALSPIAPLTPPPAQHWVEMEAAQNVAPLLSAIEPATANPPDKPAHPAPNEAPAASPSKIAGSDASSPVTPLTPPPAPHAVEMNVAQGDALPAMPPVPPSGTPVAINGQRMKSAVHENKIAGSKAQELPPDRQNASATAGADEAIPAARERNPASFSDPKDLTAQWMIMDTTGKGAAVSTLTANVAEAGAPTFGRIEQVERLISREVVMVRQSGAEALAVSLKVDSGTSLFLQLTNHHGHIEAAVRCESGDAAALDAHWKQLQESLARQNVQLLPLQDKSLPAGPSSDAPADASGNFQDGPPARQQPPPPAPGPEKPSDSAMNAAVGLSKPKNKHHRHPGWETWA